MGKKGGEAKAKAKEGPLRMPVNLMDLPDVPSGRLPAEVELARTRVVCGPDFNSNTEDYMNANSFMACGVDNAFTLEDFKERFSIDVTSIDESTMTFEMKGVGPAVANALRRILLAEVPTVAIEKVFVVNNTSVVPDEVLAHRLGLVPLAVDPRLLEYRAEGDAANESNTLVLRLRLKCTRGNDGQPKNDAVLSKHLEWLALGSQLPEESEEKLTAFAKPQSTLLPAGCAAVHPDILLAKMRPGQEIELEAHAVKGKGKTHAKWSPVGTAWYQLCPEVVTLQSVRGEDATAFIAKVHPPNWDAAHPAHPRGLQSCYAVANGELQVRNSRGCWYCLERVRRLSGEPRWADKVQLRLVKEHYLFTIESVGQLPPEVLFTEAVAILREKCIRLASGL